MANKFFAIIFLSFLILGCEKSYKEGSFGYDLKILEKVKDITVLKQGESMIAVSGAYQGRIFTSTSTGMSGRSYGWFKRNVIQKDGSDTVISTLGGEGRFWFGPEIGKYSIFFDPGAEQVVANVKITPDLNTNLFEQIDQSASSVTYGNEMSIRNANGYTFNLFAKRKISIKPTAEIEKDLGVQLGEGISTVAFSAETSIKNTGEEQWTKENGLLSIWDIGCMLPSDECTVIIPITMKVDSITRYFTPIDSSRIKIKDQVVYYRADGKYMNKIGIQPDLCSNVFGSYSPELNLLNIVKYNFENDSMYANSLWGHEDPYKGDVINIFNGEVNESLGRNWPFFEMETSSSVKELNVGEQMSHMQSVYHFEGSQQKLDDIAKVVLGVSLTEVRNVLN